jgi:tryptophan synthase alpha chain
MTRLRGAAIVAAVVLGFGVSTAEQARAALGFGADGGVMGSAALQERTSLAALLKDIRRGLDG